jgi:predicted PurR-regulated permease PerM
MTEPTRRSGRDTGAKVRTVSLVILATLAVIAALVAGRDLLVPVALALLFTLLLRPAVRVLERFGMPTALASLLVLLFALAVVGGVVLAVERPIVDFAHEIPATLGKARHRIENLRSPLKKLERVTQQVQQVASGDSGKAQQQAKAPPPSSAAPGEGTRVAARIFGTTATLLAQFVEVVVLAFFLLASGRTFLERLVAVIPSRRDKNKTVIAVHEIEAATAHYLLATGAINFGQGVLVALAVWGLGVPSPWLWGALTFVMEFIPYLGGLAMMILLAAVGLATFDEPLRIVAPPLAYLTISTLQNNIVSPVAYGRRLKLNPLVLLVAVLFWWELWGVPGAFIAVPMVAAARIICERSDRLKPLALFLGD